ncbi:MAG: hypothetical protein N2Z58_03205 [Fervidobacterium sp.]|nr:hypothetical protein [Fervidobacterium sp.]
MKKSNLVKILLGIFIAIVLIFILFLIGYSSFLEKQLYGEKSSLLQAWRNYLSYLFSQIPIVKNFVKYESLDIMSAKEYFEKIYNQYSIQLNEKLKELEKKELEIAEKSKQIDNILNSLKSIEESWKEQRLKEELNKVEDIITLKRLQDIVDTFSNSDPAQLRRLMSSDNMSVETLAIVLSRLTPDIRAEMIQQLTSANPTKAAQVVEKIGGVDQIISELDLRTESLRKTIEEMVTTEAEIVTLSGFSKGLSAFLKEMSYEQLWDFITKIRSKPDLVFYLISSVDNQTMVRLLKDIKDKDEELFIQIMNKGAKF